jgi:hypothetical protein
MIGLRLKIFTLGLKKCGALVLTACMSIALFRTHLPGSMTKLAQGPAVRSGDGDSRSSSLSRGKETLIGPGGRSAGSKGKPVAVDLPLALPARLLSSSVHFRECEARLYLLMPGRGFTPSLSAGKSTVVLPGSLHPRYGPGSEQGLAPPP